MWRYYRIKDPWAEMTSLCTRVLPYRVAHSFTYSDLLRQSHTLRSTMLCVNLACFILSLMVGSTFGGIVIKMVSEPAATIQTLVDQHFTLKCDVVEEEGAGVEGVHRLESISYTLNDENVAIVVADQGSPTITHPAFKDKNAKATDYSVSSHKNTGRLYLDVPFPDDKNSGTFKCKVSAYDSVGYSKTIPPATLAVATKDTTENDLVEIMYKLMTELKSKNPEQDISISKRDGEISNLQTVQDTQGGDITSHTNQIGTLQSRQNTHNTQIGNLNREVVKKTQITGGYGRPKDFVQCLDSKRVVKTVNVYFGRTYEKPPKVFVSISGIQEKNEKTVLSIEVQNIYTDHFKLFCITAYYGLFDNVYISWIAFPSA